MAQMSSEEMSRHAEQEPRLPERSAGSSERLRMGSPIRDYKSQSKTPAANARKRTRAGEARIDSEAGYRRLFEAAQDGILIALGNWPVQRHRGIQEHVSRVKE